MDGKGTSQVASGARLPLAVSSQGTLLETGPQAMVRASNGNHQRQDGLGFVERGGQGPQRLSWGQHWGFSYLEGSNMEHLVLVLPKIQMTW